MFRVVGDFISRQKKRLIPSAPQSALSPSDLNLISMFSQNLDAFNQIPKTEESGPIFRKLVGQFLMTFQNVMPEHLNGTDIQTVLGKYVGLCCEIGKFTLREDNEATEQLSASLARSVKLLGCVPNGSLFFDLFLEMLRRLSTQHECLKGSHELMCLLFRNTEFLNEFWSRNGFVAVFKLVFLNPHLEASQKMFLDVLFRVVPVDFYKSRKRLPKQNLSKLFIELVTERIEKQENFGNLCRYMSHFVLIGQHFEDNSIKNFRDCNGFNLMNQLFVEKCSDAALDCYEVLMIESGINTIVLENMFALYQDSRIDTNLRSSLVHVLGIRMGNPEETYAKLTAFTPLTSWLLPPPKLNEDALRELGSILKEFCEAEFVVFTDDLETIISLIAPPEKEGVPVEVFLDVLLACFESRSVTPSMLMSAKFFDYFVLNPHAEDIATYFASHKKTFHLVTDVYVSDIEEEFRFLVLQKLLVASQFRNDFQEIEFFLNLFDQQFSLSIVELLLSFLSQPHILIILTRVAKVRAETVGYFLQAHGFDYIDEFLAAVPTSALNVMKLVSALAHFSPHSEIDEWINRQPITSPIFNCRSDFLAQMAVGFSTNNYLVHVPSLLPFSSDFDASSPLNLYLVGKYGVTACLNRNRSLLDIPHMSSIANRYIEPETARELFMLNPSKICEFIDLSMPQFALYEFVPLIKPGYLRFRQRAASISFWFRVPRPTKAKLTILSAGSFSLNMVEESLIFSTSTEQIALLAQSEAWHHVVVHIHHSRTNSDTAEIILDLQHFGPVKSQQSALPEDVVFGNRLHPLPTALHLAESIMISSVNFTESEVIQINRQGPIDLSRKCACSERSDFVYLVKYLGFASYFRSSIQIENLFGLLEMVKSNEQFKSVYLALLNLQKLHMLKFTKFWSRLLLSFKRCRHVVESRLLFYLIEHPLSFYDVKHFAKVLFLFLSDIESWHVFPIESIRSVFQRSMEIQDVWEKYEEPHLFDSMLTILRSGLREELSEIVLVILANSLGKHATAANLRAYFNAAVSICDWKLEKNEDLLRKPVSESPVQNSMLSTFVSKAQTANLDVELYECSELLEFMFLFLDERAIILMDLLSYYSQRNPKYIKASALLSYVFEKLSFDVRTWNYAFGILTGTIRTKKFPEKFEIQRPAFLGAFLGMLSDLSMKTAYEKMESIDCAAKCNLLARIMKSLISLEKSQYAILAQTMYDNLLHNLENLGISPNSYELNATGERKEKVWASFAINMPNKDELKTVCDLVTHTSVYTATVPENLCYEAEATKSTAFLYFPDNSDSSGWMIDLAKKMKLAHFFANIILAAPPGQYPNILASFVFGTASMYKDYATAFGQELSLCVLSKLANASLSEYYKPTLMVMHRMAMHSLFADSYLRFLTLILDFFRFLNASASFEQFLTDEKILKVYRDMLLAAFSFIAEGNSLELYKTLSEYRAVVFQKVVFNDNKFSTRWIHVTRQRGGEAPERIRCMELAMKLIDGSLMTTYSAGPAQADWLQFKSKTLKSQLENRVYEERITRANQIVEGKQRKYAIAARCELISRIYRVCNFECEQAIVLFNISEQMRFHERSLYDHLYLAKKWEYQNTLQNRAFHLSPVALPMYQSRALSPSPFPMKTPPSGTKTNKAFFALPFTPTTPRIPITAQFGSLNCSPEWCYFHQEGQDYSSPFEYSHVFDMDAGALMQLFGRAFSDMGTFTSKFNVDFFYFIHAIPSVLFVSESSMLLLVLASTNETGTELQLVRQPKSPVGFLPFTESVALGEFSRTTLFCGHVVVVLQLDRIVKVRRHLYIHKKLGLSVYPFGGSDIILVFKTTQQMQDAEKVLSMKVQLLAKVLPPTRFYFNIPTVEKATNLWTNNVLSNFDYLMLLNSFGGRSFSDLSQYPVLPWSTSPKLEPRDLSKPMGQLGKNRAAHFDQTYELSSPQYYYGFHYSLPGVVFWLMMRLPPFTFFQWDLNEGWDDSQRLFTSIIDAYQSASYSNPSDLKELLPEMYTTPEALVNSSHLDLGDDINDNVILPGWANNNPHFFVETSMKLLNCAPDMHKWIDLIFGFKETGEAAVEFKNLFLPSSYHDCTAEDVDMEEDAFASQVLNFGQCPIQLFTEPHPPRLGKHLMAIDDIAQNLKFSSVDVLNKEALQQFKCIPFKENSTLAIPILSAVVLLKSEGKGYYIRAVPEQESLSLVNIGSGKVILSKCCTDYAFVSHVSISHDSLLMAVSYSFGRVDIYQIVYDKGAPYDFHRISYFSGSRKCTESVLVSHDFICATLYGKQIVLWNTATQIRHREIDLDITPIGLHFDQFNGVLSVVGAKEVIQYSINGDLLHKYETNTMITSFAFLPFDFAFDRRLLFLGRADGTICIISVDPVDYKLKEIGMVSAHKHAVSSMYIDPVSFVLVTCDVKGRAQRTVVETMDEGASLVKCYICNNPMTSICSKCHQNLCDACRDDASGMCWKCAGETNFFQFPSF